MSNGGTKLERKVIEKNRRDHMKRLCFKLVSLVPPHHFNPPKELLSQQDQIEQVAGYIQNLSERVEKLKGRKEQIMPNSNNKISKRSAAAAAAAAATTTTRSADSLPILKIRDLGSSFEVVVIIGLTKNLGLNRVVRVLEEEGAEVLALSMSNMGHKIFHTLHAQAKVPRVGVDISRICGRLEEVMMF